MPPSDGIVLVFSVENSHIALEFERPILFLYFYPF